MKKSRKTNRVKPTDKSWENSFPECAGLFQRAGWFNYFQRIDGFYPEVSYHFTQGFDKEIVSFDALNFELTKELIAKATGIASDGELWFKKIPFTFNLKYFLLPEGEALDLGKGVQLGKINPEWR